MKSAKAITIFILLLVLFLSVSSLGYQDEQDQQLFYCQNVSDGTWPNYENIDCGEINE